MHRMRQPYKLYITIWDYIDIKKSARLTIKNSYGITPDIFVKPKLHYYNTYPNQHKPKPHHYNPRFQQKRKLGLYITPNNFFVKN